MDLLINPSAGQITEFVKRAKDGLRGMITHDDDWIVWSCEDFVHDEVAEELGLIGYKIGFYMKASDKAQFMLHGTYSYEDEFSPGEHPEYTTSKEYATASKQWRAAQNKMICDYLCGFAALKNALFK